MRTTLLVIGLFFVLFLGLEPNQIFAAQCAALEPSCDTVQSCTDGNGFTHSVLCKYTPPPPVGCNFTDATTSVTDGDYIRYTINFSSGTLTQYYTTGSCGVATGGTGDPSTPYCFAGMGSTPRCGGHTSAQGEGTCIVHAQLSDGNSCQLDVSVTHLSEPDLRVTSFNMPSGAAGASVNASVTIRNIGDWPTPGSFEVAVNRNRSTMDCGTNEHGNVVTAALGAGLSRTVSVPVTLPGSNGSYTAIAMVDSDCQVGEEDEGNNTRTDDYVVGSCTSVAPSASLVTPLDNSTIGSTSNVTVNWTSSYGTACPQPNNNITFLRVRNDTDGIYLTSGAENGQNVGTSTNGNFSGLQCGKTYSWWVGISNSGGSGPGGFQTTPFWRFSTPSCSTPAYFRTFNGDVTAAIGQVGDPNLISGNYISGIISGQNFSDGVVSAGTTIDNGAGSSSVRNFRLTTNPISAQAIKNSDYESLKVNALKFGGYSDSDIPTICASAQAPKTINGQTVKYSCWSGSGLNSAISTAISDGSAVVQIILPNPSATDATITSSPALGNIPVNKHIIVFVPNNVTISQGVNVNAGINSIFSLVAGGNVTVGDGTIGIFDGMYIFDGTFGNTVGATQMNTVGGLLGVGGSGSGVNLQRQTLTGSSENITFAGKYLKNLQNILARPKTTWVELPPQ